MEKKTKLCERVKRRQIRLKQKRKADVFIKVKKIKKNELGFKEKQNIT